MTSTDITNIINNINSKSNYNEKEKLIKDSFEFEKFFKNKGVQGVAGILKFKSKSNDEKEVVFKLSNSINNSLEYENMIIKNLSSLSRCCPHFLKTYGILNILPEHILGEYDYFNLLNDSVLLIEYISN